MSITPPGLVSGPALVQPPPLIPAVSAPQPVSAASNAKNEGGSSGDAGRSSGSGAIYVPQRREDQPPLYDKPSALDASASRPATPQASAHLHPYNNAQTAYQDSATLAAPPATAAKAAKNLAEVAASAAYAMVADAGTMPDSAMHPLRGS